MALPEEERDDSLEQQAAEQGAAPHEAAARRRAMRDSSVDGGGEGDGVPTGKLQAADSGAEQRAESADAAATQRTIDAKASAKTTAPTEAARGTGKLGENAEKVGQTLKALSGNKKALIGIATGGGLIGIMLAIFLLLIPLKLEHMLKNLEDFRFKRQRYTYDRIGQKYMKEYLKARIELGKDPSADAETKYFSTRGGKDGPFASWYDRMQKLPFEDRLAQNQGIRFVGNGNGDAVILRVDNVDDKIDTASKVDDLFATGADSGGVGEHARARLRIKQVVNDELPSWRIVKRHNMRLYLQAATGIKKWRFFEKTSDKADNFVRAYYVKGVLEPLHGKIGANIDCLLGGKSCPKTNSTNSPENNATGTATGSVDRSAEHDQTPQSSEASDKAKSEGSAVADASDKAIQDLEQQAESGAIGDAQAQVDRNATTDLGKKFIPANLYEALLGKAIGGKVAPGINYIGMLDMLDSIRKLLKNDVIGKMIAIKNSLQYASYFAAFAVATDNLKAGQDVNIAQVNAMMNKTKGYEKSAGYEADIHPNQANPYKVDPTKKVTNEDTSALTDTYNNSVGAVLNPILDNYDVGRNAPGIKQILDFLENLGAEVGGFAFKQFSGVIKDVTGFDSEAAVHDLLGQGLTKMIAMVAGPVVDGTETGPDFYNALDAGANVTSNQYMQAAGGHLLSDQQLATLDVAADANDHQLEQQQSAWTRIASLNDQNSISSRLLMAAPLSTGEWTDAGASTIAAISAPTTTIKHAIGSLMKSISGTALAGDPAENQRKNEKLWGVPPYGLTDQETPDPTDPRMTSSACESEISAYKEAMASNDQEKMDHFKSQVIPGAEGSPCTMYKTWSDASECMYNDNQECGGVDAAATPTQCTAQSSSGQDSGIKSAYILGDSLTEGDYYENTGPGFLKDSLDAAHINATANASSGRAISIAGTDRDKTSGLKAVEDDKAIIKTSDAVVVDLGTNEDGNGSVSAYKKNVEKLADKIHSINPDAKIYWVNIFSPGIKDKADRNKALEDVAKSKNFTVIDADGANISMDGGTSDKIHPGPAGYKQLSKVITDALSSGASGDSCAPDSQAGSTIDVSKLYDDSTGVACAPGTKDLGTQDGYTQGKKVKIRICAVSNLPSTGQESQDQFGVKGAGGKAVVNSRVSGAVYAMVEAMKKDGLHPSVNSAFRTMAHQQALCPCDGVNVAIPGTSNHQMGAALDFDGPTVKDAPDPGDPTWAWLHKNASKFGYKPYTHESWHWSPTGS